MRVVIPMGGVGQRFLDAGHTLPKPLLPVRGRPVIAHLLDRFPADWPRVFYCNEDHLARTRLGAVLAELAPGAPVVPIPPHKRGPVWSVLEGARRAPETLPDDEPCLVNYCDFDFTWDSRDFEAFTARTGRDGAVVCYTGWHPEYLRPTLYAYCREEEGRLLAIREKGHFTPDRTREYASSGTYWFRSGALVRDCFARLMAEGPLLGGEGYVSVAFQHLLADGRPCRIYEIPWFHQWGTPEDLADFTYWAAVFDRWPYAGLDDATRPDHAVLMPMAGRGSRFPAGVPKPFVPVLGQPMFRAALDRLPARGPATLVVREELAAETRRLIDDGPAGAAVVTVPEVTAGQAVTTDVGAARLDPDEPVLVSSCDHGLVWDPAAWHSLLDEGPDLVVVGQRGYPGADRTPAAFAYLVVAEGTDRVAAVSVKTPVSDDPRGDLVLVGTFWFRTVRALRSLVAELVDRDLRVNGELYLDSVVGLAVERGWDVRAFAADGYLCWGTPDALREFDYWHRRYTGRGRETA